MKFLILAALIIVALRYITGKWPWELLGGSRNRAQALFRARTLLGVNANATRSEIMDAHRRLLGLVHPDRGGSNSAVIEANDARDLLLAALPTEDPTLR